MMKPILAGIALAAMAAAIPTGARAQLVAGQIDMFQGGSTDGWTAGGPGGKTPPNPPFVVPTGGPTGGPFLDITSSGCPPAGCVGNPSSPPGTGTPGSQLTAFNVFNQWEGDYFSISGISMYLENLGSTTLNIRLEIEDPTGASDMILSTSDAVLAPDSGWQQVFFPTNALSDWNGNVDAIYGYPPSDVDFDLSNATALRILNAPTDTSDYAPIAGQLGVTDIAAVPTVPEPPSILLLGAALLGGALVRRRRRFLGLTRLLRPAAGLLS